MLITVGNRNICYYTIRKDSQKKKNAVCKKKGKKSGKGMRRAVRSTKWNVPADCKVSRYNYRVPTGGNYDDSGNHGNYDVPSFLT